MSAPGSERQKKRQTDARGKVEVYFDFINTFALENSLVSEKLRDAITVFIDTDYFMFTAQ